MKINLKKVASVLASAVMLGSTIGFAAAAWPAPFVSNGTGDAAIVVGASAAATDMAAATNLANSLNTKVTATGTTVGGEGDKFRIGDSSSGDKMSEQLNLGDGISTVLGTAITKDNLPTLLADGVFYNKQNTEYKYSQKINVANLSFQYFKDSELNDNTPTLGFKINSGYVANYTLTFDTSPESASSTTDSSLTDLENKNIEILGKNYYILDFKNTTTSKITLLDAATSSTVSEGETKTLTVGDKTYTVAISFIASDQVILTVNGVNTEKLSATGTSYGNTYKLPDGTYIGIKNINVQDYAGGTKNVEFSIGAGKLELTNGNAIKLNDKTVEEIYAYISLSTAAKVTWDKLVLQWTTDGKKFLTAGGDTLVMPGFEAVKFTMADTTMPKQEITAVEADGDEVAQLRTTIKDGDVTIPILTFDTSTGNVTSIGKSTSELLETSNTTTLVFNATDSSSRFIASWANSRDSESYYLKAKVEFDSDNGKNYVTLTNVLTGAECKKDANDTTQQCQYGNAVITVAGSSYVSGGEKSATLTINSGGSFHELYTKDGMKVYLPFSSTVPATKGAINLSAADNSQFVLWFGEENKNGDIEGTGSKAFNMTISTSGTTTKRVTISNVDTGSSNLETSSGSKIWESYVQSELASKTSWDKTDSDQYSAEVEYHGGEVYANVYVAAPSIQSGSATSVKVIKDSEVDSAKDKNLIVVGGSCINTVAAKMLGSTAPVCGEDFTALTQVDAGKYLIKVAASDYNAQKMAMLVAGYEAADTTTAVDKVIKEGVDASTTSSTVYPLAATTA